MAQTPFPNRRSIRLREYDYTHRGAYFVTICAMQRLCLFGEMQDGEFAHSAIGQIVASCWEDLPHHTQGLALDGWVVMPNHLHGVIILSGAAATGQNRETASRGLRSGLLGTVIGGFKSAVSRTVGAHNVTLIRPIWQRNYYERIIRNDRELDAARRYIMDNPARWNDDPNHPRHHQASNLSTRQ